MITRVHVSQDKELKGHVSCMIHIRDARDRVLGDDVTHLIIIYQICAHIIWVVYLSICQQYYVLRNRD